MDIIAQSNTNNFFNIQAIKLIEDAFQRCGIKANDVSGYELDSVLRSVNLVLSNWANKGINLWTTNLGVSLLISGQPSYQLPQGTIDVLDMTTVNLRRVLGGTPTASAGTAANAFDGNLTTSCNAGVNGWIQYEYLAATPIYYVGIVSAVTANYTINVEYSYDGDTWITATEIPPQQYLAGVVSFVSILAPIACKYYRIIETTDLVALNVAQLYFDIESNARVLSSYSRSEWIQQPNKLMQSIVSSYYVDRQVFPYIKLWPVPGSAYFGSGNAIVYNYTYYVTDVTYLYQRINIPQRFMMALVKDLAADIAEKFAPQIADQKKMYASAVMVESIKEDIEKVPIRIAPDPQGYT